ncbi:MAG: efflux RND transporter periplasmic adaptor subunit [Bacteroidales bacterium]
MNKSKTIPCFLPSVICGMVLLITCSCQQTPGNSFTVMKGKFVQSVTETGELEAIRATSIIMPRISYQYGYSFKLVGLADHGSMVEKGDSVVALDPSSIYKYIIQREEALEKAKAEAEKQKVQSEIKRRDIEVQLKNEEASYELKKLEMERMQFESEMIKEVKELEFKKAGVKLNIVKRKLALYPLLDKYDLFISELQISQLRSDIRNAQDVLQNLVLYSPGNGYFQINYNRYEGQTFKLGDEVYMGSMIASIPDVSQMKVRSSVNETDINKVKEGMKVIIRLDALPELKFEGTVKEISKICLPKEKQKIFTTEIQILQNDPRLKPGMSVSCEYICYESDDALFVPNSSLISEGGKVVLYLQRGGKFEKREVETGVSNSNHTILHTKLKPGQALLSPDE